VDQLIEEVAAVRGVGAVENRLDVHHEPGDVPALQSGDKPRPMPPSGDIFQRRWSPARLMVILSGATLAYAIARPQFLWTTLVSLGLAGYASAGKDVGRGLLPRRPKGKQLNALSDGMSTGWSS
jgi:hypothetical protein